MMLPPLIRSTPARDEFRPPSIVVFFLREQGHDGGTG
jgi:hypothetical protein